MKKNNRKISPSFYLRITTSIFIGLLITLLIIWLISFVLRLCNVDLDSIRAWQPVLSLTILIAASSIVGLISAYLLNKSWIKEIDQLQIVLNDISNGIYTHKLKLPSLSSPFYEAFVSFNKMLDELNSNTILKADFISNFSHEFKTPIVSIKGYAELLEEDINITDEEKKKYLDIIIEESKRLSNLSKQTMLMCNLDSTAIVNNKDFFSLNQQIDECIIMLDNDLKKKNITTLFKIEPIEIFSNKDLLKEVWINILSNSIKYSNNNGRIDISSYQDDKHLIISIRDNGIGMSEETSRHIFDKYYQADKSHNSHGIGLGLSISKRIIELCEGSIEVKSVLNQGSIFNIILPISIVKKD